MLKGGRGHKTFWVSFNVYHLSFSHTRGGGAQNILTPLDGRHGVFYPLSREGGGGGGHNKLQT